MTEKNYSEMRERAHHELKTIRNGGVSLFRDELCDYVETLEAALRDLYHEAECFDAYLDSDYNYMVHEERNEKILQKYKGLLDGR